LNDNGATVILETESDEGPVSVEGELAGVDAAGGAGLQMAENSSSLIDGKCDERIRRYRGGVARIVVGDGELAFEARADYDKVGVGLGGGKSR
jgi:hypothetical protein